MGHVVVIGGGWAGCAAALEARRDGCEVVLLERTDMLLGTGLVGGIMRNNGRYTATEEMIAMGGGSLFELCDTYARHHDISFPGHDHATLYDIVKVPPAVEKLLIDHGVKIHYQERVRKIKMDNQRIQYVVSDDGYCYDGDVFIDATGTAGGINNCCKYGNGCCMCIIRCPAFGGRVSIAGLAGVKEKAAMRSDGSIGAMSGSCKVLKESLGKVLQDELNERGVVIIPVPKALQETDLNIKTCQQYALPAYRENIILLDTGHGKLMTPYFPLEKLRQIPGLEHIRYEDPYAAGVGNSIRYMAITPRNNFLQVEGVDNLLCAGEKIGNAIGHTEAICSGVLAGYNANRLIDGKQMLEIPRELAVGDFIAVTGQVLKEKNGLQYKYTFSGSVYFEHMKQKGLYSTDISEIQKRVEQVGMKGVFSF